MTTHALITLLFSFLLGAIPFGYLLFRLTDRSDIREMGSGNIGAGNVLRTKGVLYGLLILLLDSTKGALPILYTSHHFPHDRPLMAMVALAAVLGHIYSPFLKGKGGKGVATFFGALLLFSPWIGLFFLIVFCVTAFACRFVSASSVAAVSLSFMAILFCETVEVSMLIITCTLIVIFQHRQNIQRILSGQESRLCKRNRHE